MKTRTAMVLAFGTVVLIGAFLVYGLTSDNRETTPSSKQKKPPVVEAISVEKARISHDLELTGSVEPYRVARLASPAEGPILHIRVREGDRVKTGDALLSIGRTKGVDALIASLREELKKEEDNLNRTRQLVENKAIPGEQLDQARAAYEKVRAQWVKAEETVRDHTIEAPWKGVVSRVLVKEGEFVAPRAALLEMYDPSSLVIRAAVPEKYAAEIATGMRVAVQLDAYPDGFLDGRIDRVFPYLDPRLRTRPLEIAIDKPMPLIPGMFARLKVFLKTVDEAVVVPVEAMVATPNGRAVFVVENGHAVRRLVKTGIEAGNRIQILAGVFPGDRVIVVGNRNLKDGMPVSLVKGEAGDFIKTANPVAQPGKRGIQAGGDPE